MTMPRNTEKPESPMSLESLVSLNASQTPFTSRSWP
jgi:hypothetical protein